MKKKEVPIKVSSEINRIKAEYDYVIKKFGKNNPKSQYLEQLLNFQYNKENVESNMNSADIKGVMSEWTREMERAIEIKNVGKKYDEFNGTVNDIAKALFDAKMSDDEIIASATLFMYLIDCGYSNQNKFKDEEQEKYLYAIGSQSTGEMMAYSALDSDWGKFRFFQKLLEKGLSLTSALEYSELIDISGEPMLQVVTVGEPKIIPYHLFQNNNKNFVKSLKLDDNAIGNGDFWDFSASLEKVGEKVANAVIDFWGIRQFMMNSGLMAFLNLTTFETLHSLYSQYLSKKFSDNKTAILKMNGKYISARKLLECILIKNEINYTTNADLLYRDQYYLKVEFDENTMVKYMPFSILSQEGELNNLDKYISSNAFSIGAGSVEKSPAEEISSKMDEDFVPSSAEEVMMEFIERQAQKGRDIDELLNVEQVENDEEFKETTSVDMSKAKQEEQELKNQVGIDGEIENQEKGASVFDSYKMREIDDNLVNFDEDELFNSKLSQDFGESMSTFLDSKPKKETMPNDSFDDLEISLDDLKIAHPKNAEQSDIINDKDFFEFSNDTFKTNTTENSSSQNSQINQKIDKGVSQIVEEPKENEVLKENKKAIDSAEKEKTNESMMQAILELEKKVETMTQLLNEKSKMEAKNKIDNATPKSSPKIIDDKSMTAGASVRSHIAPPKIPPRKSTKK